MLSSIIRPADDVEKPKTTVDVVRLNNVVVKMHNPVKFGKWMVRRELKRYIVRLKHRKKITPEMTAKNERKLQGRLEELTLLQKLPLHRLCKAVLANELTMDALEKVGDKLSARERLVIRLSHVDRVANYVTKFRTEHPDWLILVDKLLYKNTSRKMKTKKQKLKQAAKRKAKLSLLGYLEGSKPTEADADAENEHESTTIQSQGQFEERNKEEIELTKDEECQPEPPCGKVRSESPEDQIDSESKQNSVPDPGEDESAEEVEEVDATIDSNESEAADKEDDTAPVELNEGSDDDILGSDDAVVQSRMKHQQRTPGSNPTRFHSTRGTPNGRGRGGFRGGARGARNYPDSSRPGLYSNRPRGHGSQGYRDGSHSNQPRGRGRGSYGSHSAGNNHQKMVNMHPSWTAKRDQKLKLKDCLEAGTSQAKRIKFSDD